MTSANAINCHLGKGSGFRILSLILILHDLNSEDLEKILPGENLDRGQKSEPGTSPPSTDEGA